MAHRLLSHCIWVVRVLQGVVVVQQNRRWNLEIALRLWLLFCKFKMVPCHWSYFCNLSMCKVSRDLLMVVLYSFSVAARIMIGVVPVWKSFIFPRSKNSFCTIFIFQFLQLILYTFIASLSRFLLFLDCHVENFPHRCRYGCITEEAVVSITLT